MPDVPSTHHVTLVLLQYKRRIPYLVRPAFPPTVGWENQTVFEVASSDKSHRTYTTHETYRTVTNVLLLRPPERTMGRSDPAHAGRHAPLARLIPPGSIHKEQTLVVR
jgi:hypothetical protein